MSLDWLATGGLIVSCQAPADSPLHGPVFMAAMARAAEQAGAIAIRAEGVADVAAIRAAVKLPIIGIRKRPHPDFEVVITPGLADVAELLAAGADMVALDATPRARDGEPLPELVQGIKARWNCAVMADVATSEQGARAAALGCDVVATTLSGYTADSPRMDGPDLDLVARLATRLRVPVVAEGRFTTPEEVRRARALGARAVVVGTAITNPRDTARRFVAGATP